MSEVGKGPIIAPIRDPTRQCPKKERQENPFYINCQEYGHSASYTKCPKFPKSKKGSPLFSNKTFEKCLDEDGSESSMRLLASLCGVEAVLGDVGFPYVRWMSVMSVLQISRGCGSPVVKESNHGRHVMSSIPVPLKTRRVGQRCTLNVSRAETSSRWCGVVVRRGGASSGVVHVT
ncbi:uncharacterized protein TNCV_1426871 [Trichonephila clavipes]|nr:uncharacterized protein TNCV_1426871 [Trichonephila clavipes]